MKNRFSIIPFLIVLVLAATKPAARAGILTVGGNGGEFSSPARAVAAAKPLDTIEVHSGTYVGELVLDRPVVLRGIGRPVLRGSGRGSVVRVEADGCTVRDFVIEYSGGDLQKEDSAILLKSSGNYIEGNEIRDTLYGIYLYRSGKNVIRRNVIYGRKRLSLGERGAGLHVWNSAGNTIEDNTISEMRDGLYIQSSPGNIVRRNRIFNLRYGLHYMSSDANTFENNLFSHNVAGAAIMYSKKIEFRRNAFTHNRGFSSFGVLFQECEQCLAGENLIIDNTTGIFLEAVRKSTFQRNVVAQNDVALQMFSSADENTFSRNNFVQNLSPLLLIGKRSTTRWQSDGHGNFWSDYEGYDLNGDGIGDVPHKIQNVFQYMEGDYPRLRIYLDSPAAQALAVAEKTFPVIQGSPEVDSAPLVRTVGLPFVFDQDKPDRPFLAFGAMSLAMLLSAMVILWGAQRR